MSASIKIDFNDLLKATELPNTLHNDRALKDNAKSIIFRAEGDNLYVVGHSHHGFSRTLVEGATLDGLEDREWLLQLKAVEINKILQGYSALYKTKVDKVLIEEATSGKIRLTFSEVPLDEEDVELEQDSVFYLNNVKVRDNVLKEIKTELPENLETQSSNELSLYISSLMPSLTNNSAGDMASVLNFGDDQVLVISSQMTSAFKNGLNDSFKQLALPYTSVAFLKKVLEQEEIQVSKTDHYLVVVAGNSEAFLRYQPLKVKYNRYVEGFKKDTGIVIDRLYWRDVLKRLEILGDTGKFKISAEGDLVVESENFKQHVPLIGLKGDEPVDFNIPVALFQRAILGEDAVFKDQLFLYYYKNPGAPGYTIYLSDETGAWFTTFQVRSIATPGK